MTVTGLRSMGERYDINIRNRHLSGPMRVLIWQSPGSALDAPMPLIIANDGIEYIERSGLITWLDEYIKCDALPPMRVIGLHPVNRDVDYRTSDAYADTLAEELLPFLSTHVPTTVRIGMGASLGALAVLHAHRRHHQLFDALMLQSGSFFMDSDLGVELCDPTGQIRLFTHSVLDAQESGRPIPVRMTCARIEPNLACNRAMAAALERQGYSVTLDEVAGGHDWPHWADAWTPGLFELLSAIKGS